MNLDPGAISVKLGDGAGGFSSPLGFAFAVHTSPQDVVLGDFNGDGKLDAAVSNMNSNNVSVAFGDGLGLFSGMFILPVGANPRGLSAGDFNSDGKLDLVVANNSSSNISLILANPAGGFGAAVNFPVGLRPLGLASADLNGDGWLDVVTANTGLDNLSPGDVSVLFGTGAGQFAHPVSFPAGIGTGKVVINDFNGDAKGDLVVANFYGNTLSVLLNGCAGAPILRTIRFDAPTLQQDEGVERITLSVTRTGNTTGAASVDYRTVDSDTFSVSCADTVNNHGSAYARCDFATVVGRLDFAAGESQKTIVIPMIDDGHDEAAETFQVVLLNPIGATLADTSAVTVTIQDNDASGAPNPIITLGSSDYPFFVRQQYLDFLSREPEAAEPWTGVMNRCANVNTGPAFVTDCDRIAVSGAFFGSPEFRVKGFYVFRFYKVAFDRLPEYSEIVTDMSFVAGQTAEEVYARKAQLATRFVQRTDFQARFGDKNNENFVLALLARHGLTQITTSDPANPDGTVKMTFTPSDLMNKLNAGQLTRAQVFRALADSDEIGVLEYNSAFVAVQYYGYLRRTPDDNGYQAWLRVINEDPNNVRIMINGFLNSTEYRLRFGRVN